MDHDAPCIHVQLDEDGHGECLIGRQFPAACQIRRSGRVGCAAYESMNRGVDWELLRVIQRWRALCQHYMGRLE